MCLYWVTKTVFSEGWDLKQIGICRLMQCVFSLLCIVLSEGVLFRPVAFRQYCHWRREISEEEERRENLGPVAFLANKTKEFPQPPTHQKHRQVYLGKWIPIQGECEQSQDRCFRVKQGIHIQGRMEAISKGRDSLTLSWLPSRVRNTFYIMCF